MKKIVTFLLCGLVLLSGCTNQKTHSSSQSTSVMKEESLSEQYDNLPADNAFDLMEKDKLKTFIEHGTGILYMSFPACPWCQAYIPMLNEVLEKNDMRAYYYNVRVDRENDHDFYEEIANLLIAQNESGDENVVQYDNDGNPLIYMPLTLFFENGKIKAWNGESNTNDSDVITPEKYWTDERVENLKVVLNENVTAIKKIQEENDAKGCDDGCSYGG